MNPDSNLRQRVRDGDLTEEQADEIASEFWEAERSIDTDRKMEREERKNDSNE
jgi:hypothetical protein